MGVETALVSTTGSSSKRRRGTERSGRRFAVKDSNRKHTSKNRNLPSPATVPRKVRKANHAFRFMVTGTVFFVLLSTISSWRARAQKRRARPANRIPIPAGRHRFQFSMFGLRSHRLQPETDGSTFRISEPNTRRTGNDITNGTYDGSEQNVTSASSQETVGGQHDKSLSFGAIKSQSESFSSQDDSFSFEELPERIEWYSRDDFKDGSRPMCRISKPYLLSNGTILVPDWMAKYEKLLLRCGLGTHSFYSTTGGPNGLARTSDIDADFALTIHPDRFQEPTHDPSVYLTEHILKSSYLFDVFGGYAQAIDGIREHHCYTTANESTCDLPRPARALLRPAIFVPKKIEVASAESWPRQLLGMFGRAHGHGHEAIHLNVSTMLLKSHDGQSENLVGTSFRSILTTDGMFRHLPERGLQRSNFYSEKNGVSKAPKERGNGPCQLSVGIVQTGDETRGIDSAPELKEKIQTLGKIAIPGSSIETKWVAFSPPTSLENHIKEVQGLDVYVGGSGDEMSSIGYLRSSSHVFELMPFGAKPNTHRSLAHVLGLRYISIGGKPQIESFKKCIEGEIFNMRKRGRIQFTETPEWHDPLIKAWDDAVSAFVLTGRSDFDLLSAEAPVRNYHSRVCALKQKIEMDVDQVARQIVLQAKDKCASAQPATEEHT